MARWLLVAFVGIAVCSLVGGHLYSPPARAVAEGKAAPALSGKPLFVQAKDGVAYILDTAEVRELGGRKFLVGREMKNSPYGLTKEQFVGATIWVPVDAITSLVELEPIKPKR